MKILYTKLIFFKKKKKKNYCKPVDDGVFVADGVVVPKENPLPIDILIIDIKQMCVFGLNFNFIAPDVFVFGVPNDNEPVVPVVFAVLALPPKENPVFDGVAANNC